MRWMLLAGLTACGSTPILHGLPRPDPAVVAGIATAAATAATIADPQAAARIREQGKVEAPPASGGREIVPPDVLERLDEEEAASMPASQPSR